MIMPLIILTTAVYTTNAYAYGRDICPLSIGAVLVQVKYKDKEPTLRPVSEENLNPGGGSSIKGLTITKSNLLFDTIVQVIKLKSGKYCGVAHKVSISLIYNQIDIKYQKKYPMGSCQHNVIITHEHKHVAIYRKNGFIYSQKIKNVVERKARNLKPMFGYSPQDVRDKISSALLKTAKTTYNKMKSLNQKQNGMLDTKKNYLKETNKCESW